MAIIIREEELKRFVQEGRIIQNGDISGAEGIKYDFHLGNRFLKAGFNTPKTFEELDAKDVAIVEPGEVVFVMTAERLEIPFDMSVQLHLKRKLSHEGINLLGGTCVDPGYSGYLIFGIHNVAGSTFKLKPGRKLVGATFYRLSKEEVVDEPSQIPESIKDFPDELVDLIETYRPVNPQVINSRLNDLQTRLDQDRDGLIKKIEAVNANVDLLAEKVDVRFKGIEQRIETQIQGVNERIIDRISDLDSKITPMNDDISSIKHSFTRVKMWGKVMAWILGIVAAVIAGLATGFFQKILQSFGQ
jgi:dCTP deaminase